MTTSNLKSLISPAFYDVHRAIKAGKINELVAKGGRGSTKSSYISVEIILELLKHPDCHAIVFRKFGNTLRNSVYNQIGWAIGELG
ncbi:MAG: phage terminase large subunit, partial [Oscillospiraceae bacterium]